MNRSVVSNARFWSISIHFSKAKRSFKILKFNENISPAVVEIEAIENKHMKSIAIHIIIKSISIWMIFECHQRKWNELIIIHNYFTSNIFSRKWVNKQNEKVKRNSWRMFVSCATETYEMSFICWWCKKLWRKCW